MIRCKSLTLRQTEGLIASLLRLLGLDLAAPDHSTRQAENNPQRQRRGDRQTRVARLAATRAAWLGLPRRNRGFREPHAQAPALAQRDVIGSPIRHSVLLFRDVMTAVLVGFEWHGGGPGSGTGPDTPSNPRRLTTDPCNKVA